MITQTPSQKTAYLVRLLPVWLLDGNHNADQCCVINNLSSNGATVLVHRSMDTLAETFDLVFMSPDNADEVLATLSAELRWKGETSFPDYIEIGVVFTEMSLIKTRLINAMTEILVQKKISTTRRIPDTATQELN